MSEWMDFCVYAIQNLMVCVALPRWGARFTRPSFMDRNPEWAAGHPEVIAQFERGGWWMKAIQSWGVISVLVLLAFRLGLQPGFLTPQALDTPSWEVLMSTNSSVLAVGLALYFYGFWSFFRWLKRNVPLSERRNAELTPRSTDDFVQRWLQYVIYGLMVANIIARPVVDALYPERLEHVWGASLILAIISAIAFICGVAGVARPPNYLDQAMGPTYRRLEIRVYFGVMVCLVISGFAGLWSEFIGVNSPRFGAVLLSLFCSVAFAAFMLLPTRPRDGSGDDHSAAAPAR